jgi:hypothetical protein
MISSFVFVVLGIYLGQEYAIYLPNIKILTFHILSYIKNNMDKNKVIENNDIKNNEDDDDDSKVSFLSYFIIKLTKKMYSL